MPQPEGKKLKPMLVGTLCNEKYAFFIPYYQRGYRWRKFQVENLLSDLVEFTSNKNNMDKYYSLQPLVVVKKNDKWSVIDGQQRLTTIYLLARKLMPESPLFEIEYESRREISNYLKGISKDSEEKNIEQFFLHQAFLAISDWIDNCNPQQRLILTASLQSCLDTGFWRLQFIWYDISDQCQTDNDEIDLFNRMNKGHLSLTSAELIKAGFCEEIRYRKTEFNSSNEYEMQRFFREWNEMENQFQDDSFWSFIYNEKRAEKKYETRIEYLFDLLIACQSAQPDNTDNTHSALCSPDDAYMTFHNYEEHKKREKKKNELWNERDELWGFYQTLLSWYHDRQFYHLIGFLIQTGESLSAIKLIIEKPENTSRLKMIAALRERIFQKIVGQCSDFRDYLKGLRFDNNNDKEKIRNILLLFNIEYLLQNESSHQRFQFDSYQNLNWDLEHICSRTNIPGDKDRKSWAENVLRYMLKMPLLIPGGRHKKGSKDAVVVSIKETIENNNDFFYVDEPEKMEEEKELRKDLLRYFETENNTEDAFIKLYNRTRDFFNEPSNIPEDDLTNLTLLDAETNRGYGNSPFVVKRQYIIEKEKASLFIPPCTRDVFMKTFSRDARHLLYWNPGSDGVCHIQEIYNLLKTPYNLK